MHTPPPKKKKKQARVEIMVTLIFVVDLANSQLQNGLDFLQFHSDLCFDPEVNNNCNFCLFVETISELLLPIASFIDFVFHWNSKGTAAVSFKAVLMEHTSVKEPSTKVTGTKMVIILIIYLAARSKSRSVWYCKIHLATEQ